MKSRIDLDAPVGQLVVEKPERARVFERFGIDYCCQGSKSLREASAGKGVDSQVVLEALSDADTLVSSQSPVIDCSRLSMSELADHIENTHHVYLRQALPRLESLFEKNVQAHGPNHPELRQGQTIFRQMKDELETHMLKEEKILFPMIRQMEQRPGEPCAHCGTIDNPIRVMEYEHTAAGSALETLRNLTGGYQPPPDACNTYRALLEALAALESDLFQHIHKENNILFPRASAAEQAGRQQCV